ncbi:MAG: hypothetical protein AAB373_03965 [Patescibacteria group bacterium]
MNNFLRVLKWGLLFGIGTAVATFSILLLISALGVNVGNQAPLLAIFLAPLGFIIGIIAGSIKVMINESNKVKTTETKKEGYAKIGMASLIFAAIPFGLFLINFVFPNLLWGFARFFSDLGECNGKGCYDNISLTSNPAELPLDLLFYLLIFGLPVIAISLGIISLGKEKNYKKTYARQGISLAIIQLILVSILQYRMMNY